jgi:hypothetical protein
MLPYNNFISYANVADYQATSLIPAPGTVVTKDNLPNGTVAIVSDQNKVLAALPSTGNIRIIQSMGSNKPLIISPIINVENIKIYSAKFQPSRQLVQYVGYNGSNTENMPTSNNTSYYLKLEKEDNDEMNRNGFWPAITAQYKTDASASALKTAQGLLKNLLTNLSKEPGNGYIKVERVANGTVAALTGTSTIAKVTKGSKVVEVFVKASADNDTLTASTASVGANDVINIPTSEGKTFTFTADALGSTAGRHVIYIGETSYVVADAGTNAQNADAIAAAINAGTQATATVATALVTIRYNECFKALPPVVLSQATNGGAYSPIVVTITSANDAVPSKYVVPVATTTAATFELDVPYQGETGYIYEGTAAATNIGVGASVTLWGIKFTGIRNTFDVASQRDYYVNNFNVTLHTGMEKAAVTTTAIGGYVGLGNYETVMFEEYFSSGNRGTGRDIINTPPGERLVTAESCREYSLIQIKEKAPVEALTNTQFTSSFKIFLKLSKDGKLPSGSLGDEIAGILVNGFSTGDLDA